MTGGSFNSLAWYSSVSIQSMTGESRTRPVIRPTDGERVIVWSATAPPIDQPMSTIDFAPRSLAKRIAASTSSHSVPPSP